MYTQDVLKKILANPNICSKEWIWQQYDHTVMGDTIQKPGGDAGVVRVHGTNKAVAASIDSSADYCFARRKSVLSSLNPARLLRCCLSKNSPTHCDRNETWILETIDL